ncbi:hypothetical protein ACS0TY_005240 [Phlomoides rotata]
MGLGVRSNNYRLRTIWTPEMDVYFVDLMLEQVGKENRRDDHLFSKVAWKHMTSMFNAKFNSKYEQDVLKNRHKMLRNLYRAIRSLLDQEGFIWDETRKMVIADNKDWDDYIQVHPEARPYRVKTIPYYTDLFNIYGTVDLAGEGVISRLPNAKFDEKMSKADRGSLLEGKKVYDEEKLCSNVLEYSPNLSGNMIELSQMTTESLHDIMIGEDYSISVGKEMVDETYQFLSDIGSTIGARTRTYWQPPMDRYFIHLMLDQVNKGNHIDGVLRKQSWREMISLFNDKFGFNYTVDILKNRYKTLRRQHNVIRNLLELDGFAWDDARQMVFADDHVWQNYIKTHTDARQYMTRPVPYFEDLCLIFRELNSDDTSHQNVDTLDEMKFNAVHPSPVASVSSSDQFHESSDSDYNVIAANQTAKRQLDAPPTAGYAKKSRMENAIRQMATAVSSLAERKQEENTNTIPVEVVVAAIQALPDMDEDFVLDACDFLEDEKKAKIFLALDVKLRKKWLTRKLRPSR